ncbi:Uncharacterised protein [Mycobacterium tuberculosis]|nr:Uncharacterised protein [Mycobacterium tuberculosis]
MQETAGGNGAPRDPLGRDRGRRRTRGARHAADALEPCRRGRPGRSPSRRPVAPDPHDVSEQDHRPGLRADVHGPRPRRRGRRARHHPATHRRKPLLLDASHPGLHTVRCGRPTSMRPGGRGRATDRTVGHSANPVVDAVDAVRETVERRRGSGRLQRPSPHNPRGLRLLQHHPDLDCNGTRRRRRPHAMQERRTEPRDRPVPDGEHAEHERPPHLDAWSLCVGYAVPVHAALRAEAHGERRPYANTSVVRDGHAGSEWRPVPHADALRPQTDSERSWRFACRDTIRSQAHGERPRRPPVQPQWPPRSALRGR